MALNFYQSYIDNLSKTPKEKYLDDLDAMIDRQFTNSSSIDEVLEETSVGSGLYSQINVRVNSVINPTVGTKFGDDYRKLIYSNRATAKLGLYYQYDNSYWLGINPKSVGLPTSSNIVVRCNNVLRFIDTNGKLQTFNVHLDNVINETYPDYKKPMALPAGTIFAYMQYNEITKEIIENRRFLIGNRGVYQAYTVHGLNNFTNENLAKLTLYIDQVDLARDDIINGIANAYDSVYTLELNSENFEQQIGYTEQLDYTIKYNGEITSGDVLWTTSDEKIGTIDSDGNIELIALGEVTFTCAMANNNSVSDSVVIDVVAIPSGIVEIRFEPNKTSISSSENPVIYTVNKFIDNVSQLDTFSFVASGADDGKYNFNVLGGNTFSVESLGFDYIPLTITATSDVDASSDTINIQLKNEF